MTNCADDFQLHQLTMSRLNKSCLCSMKASAETLHLCRPTSSVLPQSYGPQSYLSINPLQYNCLQNIVLSSLAKSLRRISFANTTSDHSNRIREHCSSLVRMEVKAAIVNVETATMELIWINKPVLLQYCGNTA